MANEKDPDFGSGATGGAGPRPVSPGSDNSGKAARLENLLKAALDPVDKLRLRAQLAAPAEAAPAAPTPARPVSTQNTTPSKASGQSDTRHAERQGDHLAGRRRPESGTSTVTRWLTVPAQNPNAPQRGGAMGQPARGSSDDTPPEANALSAGRSEAAATDERGGSTQPASATRAGRLTTRAGSAARRITVPADPARQPSRKRAD